MRLNFFLFLLLITLLNSSVIGDENDKSKNLILEKNIHNAQDNKIFNKFIIHVVEKGDTLSSISKKYLIKKKIIIKTNKLLNENYIYIGQKLIIESSTPENNNQKQTLYHEIKKGENLTEIANKYNLTLKKLIEINSIDNKDFLVVGRKLKLKEEISTIKENLIIEPKDQIDKDKIIKENKYGPLLIKSEKKNMRKRENILEATHENGKRLILQINCDRKEMNVRGIGRRWKGWMPARKSFEIELLNDYCLEFD